VIGGYVPEVERNRGTRLYAENSAWDQCETVIYVALRRRKSLNHGPRGLPAQPLLEDAKIRNHRLRPVFLNAGIAIVLMRIVLRLLPGVRIARRSGVNIGRRVTPLKGDRQAGRC
jgi:hypothetical protein